MSILEQSRVALAPPVGGGGPVAANRQLDFVCERQVQSNWCWAAVAVSIARYYRADSHWTQCALASAELGPAVCCSSPAPCNTPWYLDSALGRVGHADGGAAPGVLTLAELASELGAGQPVAVRIGYFGGGGHFVVVEGADLDEEMLDVEDPNDGPVHLSYAALRDEYLGAGAWTHTYRTRS